jgi:nitrogenase iron protein NifH
LAFSLKEKREFMTQHIALYGKGGVGKTTLVSNISAALVEAGFSAVLVGCDLDGDSCSLLHGGFPVRSVLDQIRNQATLTAESIIQTGFKGVGCVELGDSGCLEARTVADVTKALKALGQVRPFEQISPDYVLYDISGDGSGAVLQAVIQQVDICRLFVVTTSDFSALQSANGAFSFLEQYNGESNVPIPMGGLILNSIANSFEEALVNDFAYRTNARTVGKVPRSLVVRQCELYGSTVIESRPQSNQSYYYRRLANRIVDATGALYSSNLPQPLSAERLRAWSLEWADRIFALENGLVTDGAAI